MQDQRSPDERLTDAEREILYLLTGLKGEQPVWSVEDLGRKIGNAEDAEISTNGLLEDGLIHKTRDGYVFATQAGVRVVQMVGHVI
jgi:hypothetical protein